MFDEAVTFALYLAIGVFGFLCAGLLLGSVQSKRARLALPAAAYGVSGGVSFMSGSWWPLFLGYSVARLFQDVEVAADPQSAPLPNAARILVNHGLHIWAGVVGSGVFLLSQQGVLLVALLAAVVQGLDTIGFYLRGRRFLTLTDASAEVRRQFPIKAAWLFPMKVLWYGLVTLASAAVAKSFV